MAKYKLGDIAPIRQGVGPDKYPCWLLNLDMVESNTGRIIEYLYVQSDEIGASTVSFDTRNVLYSKLRPYLNKVVLPEHPGFATSEMLPLMPDTTIITREYLTHFLRSSRFVGYINEKTSGAKMPRANTADLKAVEIDCPSIEQQNAIVGVFEHLTRLIELRQHQLCTLDTLVKARFVEMFGDPIVRLERGETIQLDRIADKITVGFVGEASNDYSEDGIPYLRTQNVRVNRIDLNGLIYVNESFHNHNKKSIIHPGDVVVSRVGANRGMAAVIPESLPEANIANCLIVGQTKSVNPYYLAFYLNMSFGKRPQFGASVGSAQGVINTAILKKWEVFVPNMQQQSEFNDFAQQVDKSKVVVQAALDEVQLLFDSLMQQYFG